MRENLFSGIVNSILTIISLIFVFYILAGLLPWALVPAWSSESLNGCREVLHEMGREGHFSGACWGVIRERWIQLLFGFYPLEPYMRSSPEPSQLRP